MTCAPRALTDAESGNLHVQERARGVGGRGLAAQALWSSVSRFSSFSRVDHRPADGVEM
jgi:hypothetical protein